jgi:hypothetical protein
MHDLVARYAGPPFKILQYEIWNEPDIAPEQVDPDSPFGCWGVSGDPFYGGRYYGQMLQAVYPRVKAASAEARVIVGGLLLDCDPRNPPPGKNCTPSRFLEGILVAGGAGSFDAVSFHAYEYFARLIGQVGLYGNANWHSRSTTTGPVVSAKVDFLREVLSDYGLQGIPLMNTEAALLCGDIDEPPGAAGCEPDPQLPYEATKANYMAQVYTTAMAEGLHSNVWYSLLGWRNSGLLNDDLSPRPAYHAYDFAQDILRYATFNRSIDEYPHVKGYAFTRGGAPVWVLWSLDLNPHQISLPWAPTEAYSVSGQPLPAGQAVIVTADPIYLKGQP